MKVRVEIIEASQEERATLEVYRVTDELKQVIDRLKIKNEVLIGLCDGAQHRVQLNSIYYIEGVEKKTFVYTENQVYEISERLYQLVEKYEEFGFLRISKSVILNIDKVESVKAGLNARFEVRLSNGEKVIVSRSYVKELKRRLQF